MSKAHLPPTPPASRSPHGGGEGKPGPMDPARDKSQAEDRDVNVAQQGQTANTIQNTNNQGRQQDR